MTTTRYYVRVSTSEQKLDRQLVAYAEADKVYADKMSGADRNRPELQRMLDELQAGDLVVVKSLDRLSRSLHDLLDIVNVIKTKGADLKVLDRKDLDTTTPEGKLLFSVMGAIAEFERDIIKKRTREGIDIAKTKGKYHGRQKGAIILKGEPLARFKKFYKLNMNKTDLAKEFGVTRPTIYRWIKELQERGEI
jgi:DNA invertase Pin-like site-specific DNA recombinase